MKPIENKDFKTWRKDIPIFFNGKPFYGKAAFVNGYNGYTSSENDGCLCALIKDRRGVPSCWDDNGNPNSITNENGVPIRLKNRRGTSVELNGVLPVDYEDAYANGYNPTDFSIKPGKYGVDSYITGVFESKYNTKKYNTNMNKKLIRLTESDLHRIVNESVKRIVKESHNNEILDALYALQIALNDVLESCSSKTSRINQWATRVSQEADEIVNKYETQLNSYDSDPYKKMGRMDTAI